eukprot:COSAG02_NODE_42274_length_386_cov_0.547038_1_plen_37_part_10
MRSSAQARRQAGVFFNAAASTEIYTKVNTISPRDALP